ncbi:MAG: L-threonylcarbamoyladenylate synthase [Nocardioidaceae bacterium]
MSQRFSCADEAELDRGLAAAVEALRAGELVVLPTDTVYGLAADAFEPEAVRRLLRAKGRGRDMPPPVLVSSPTTLDALATGVPGYVRDMVSECWPGPLTVICHQQPSLSWDLGDTRETVAVRMPDDKFALALLKQSGPLAVSSANTTGQPAARSVDEAEEMLGDDVEVYLDGGRTTSDVPSTILDVTGTHGWVVRQGALPLERLREYAGDIASSETEDAG